MDKEVLRVQLWASFFLGMAGWQQHPGKCGDGGRRLSLKECADYADIMMDRVYERFPQLSEEVE